MRWILAASVMGVALAAALPARADRWMWHSHRGYWGPPVVYSYGPPVVVYPAPPPVVVYQGAPQVYAPPAPVQAMPASPAYTDTAGRYCREYQASVMVAGQPQQSYGTACLQPDGTWRMIN